jgi:phosphoenolpyruvate-protein phosphotransferase
MTLKPNPALQFVFICPLSSGLHARPASHFAEVANQFAAECTLTNLRNGLVGNGKSVLGIIAADIRHSDQCSLFLSGPDAEAAHTALRRFVEDTLATCDVPLADTSVSSRSNSIPRSLQAANVSCISGIPVGHGIAQGKVVVLRTMALSSTVNSAVAGDREEELERIKEAVSAVRHRIGERLKYAITPIGAAVLQADLAMASDVLLLEKLTEQVLRGKSAAQAVIETGEFFTDLLGHSENDYIRQRSIDIEEICTQLLEEVCGASPTPTVELREPSVLVAETIGPQQLLELNRRCLQGLVLEHSGVTSHGAILARSLGIPTLAGVRNARLVLGAGREVVVDATRGFVVPIVAPVVQRFYDRERKTLERRKNARYSSAEQSARTADGKTVEIAANASSGEELGLAFANGADGVGLFRTEMIFLGREKAPSEEEQFAIYSEAARLAAGKPVIFRTFDIGGDKKVPYLALPHEENPFLGYRGARLYADHSDLLQSQLRAILRASAEGTVQIMAPMITSVEEIVQFKAAIAQAKQHLAQNGVQFQSDIKTGIMVEVPSVAFILDQLCAEVDFFSIGTNDLSQYFFAADRGNSKLAALFSVRHPGFIQFLAQIVRKIHQHQRWVGMCGEMAANRRNLPLLIGLGLDEISVPASEVNDIKQAISQFEFAACVRLVDRAVACGTTIDVDNLLATQHLHPEPLISEDLVLLESTSQSKEEVIQEMVDAFYISNRTQDRQLLEEALWAREAVYSTGLGYGFATPHCKTGAISADSISVLRLNDPVHWGSVDGEQVKMVVLLALRDSEVANTHMQVFSSLARKLINEDFRQHLLSVRNANEVTTYLSEQLGFPLGATNEAPTAAKRNSPPMHGLIRDR